MFRSNKPSFRTDNEKIKPPRGPNKRFMLFGAVAVVFMIVQQRSISNLRLPIFPFTSTLATDKTEMKFPDVIQGLSEDMIHHGVLQNPPRKNYRIVFVGDSLTRYNYLSLVYYLHHGSWAENGNRFVTMKTKSTSAEWNAFYQYSNSKLSPKEECDCYRNWDGKFNLYKHSENRHYSDPNNNLYISFFTKFGDNLAHGHWHPDELYQQKHSKMSFATRPYAWHHKTWEDHIQNYIAKMDPKPDFFVFNQAQWTKHDLKRPALVHSIHKALAEAGIIGIYRTTLARKDGKNLGGHDTSVCSIIPHCLNVSWTNRIDTDSNYIDPVHMRASPNNLMMQQLLSLIEDIRKNPKSSPTTQTAAADTSR